MPPLRADSHRRFWKILVVLAALVLALAGVSASQAVPSQDADAAGASGASSGRPLQQGEVYVSPQVVPYRVSVNHATLPTVPPSGIKTVPEGERPLSFSPQAAVSVSDPAAQLGFASASGSVPFRPVFQPGAFPYFIFIPLLLQPQTAHVQIDLLLDPIDNFPGTASAANPPDTVGDVGPNHYVQMNNSGTGLLSGQTVVQIFNKDGTAPAGGGPFRLGGLWPAADPCNSDLGDPIVVYDHLADRWLISQFARNAAQTQFWECVAISQTPDPTAGTWFLYTFVVPVFPDYPKFGVWPDGYYMSSYEGANLGVFVFDRSNMVLGNAAGFMKTTISSLGAAGVRDTRILPADLDGPPPPNGTPNYFVRTVDDQQDPGTSDRIEVYEAEVDWLAPSFAFTLVDTLAPAAFQTMLCNRSGLPAPGPGQPDPRVRDCIPQPDEVDTVDALSNRPMMQLKYRQFDTHAAMVFNQTIDVRGSIFPTLGFTPTNEIAGVRWYELQKDTTNWAIEQQGTFTPQPIGATTEAALLHRWMGSAAMDKYGNIAVGYSIVNSNSTNGQEVYPGLRYAGHRYDDLPGIMAQGEIIILNGVNSQGNGDGAVDPQRWGDYSAMSVDPVDDCTFWFTSHVAGVGGNGAKPTQITSFQFDTCSADLSIAKSASPNPVMAGAQLSYHVTVANHGENDAEEVVVTDTLPSGVTYLADTGNCVEAPAGFLTCDLGDLAAGDSTSFTILVQVAADLVANNGGPTTLTNLAGVSSQRPDPDLSNNTVAITTLVNELADLRVSKDCKPDRSVLPGVEAVCTIVVENLGPSTARDVEAVDRHVSNGEFDFGTVTTTAGACGATPNPQAGSGTVTCTLGDVDPGGTITVRVPVSADEPVDINDQVTITSATPDPNPANNQASDSVIVAAGSDLSIVKSAAPDPVTAGAQLTYVLTVTNLGPSTAINVLVKDMLPAGVTINSASAAGGTCLAGVPGDVSRPTTCALGTMAPGAVRLLQIVVTVLPGTRGVLQNDAFVVSDNPDLNNSDNFTSVGTAVNGESDLEITKTDSPDPVNAGAELNYNISILNHGLSSATDVMMLDTLPPEVSFVSVLVTSGSGLCAYQLGPHTVTCDLNNLAPSQSAGVLIKVLVDPSLASGTVITNTATATSAESDPNGAEAIATTTVETSSDLSITKDARVDYSNPAPRVIYTIVVHNQGSSDAQDVVMVDNLPLDDKKIVYLFDTGNGACSYSLAAHAVTCDYGTLESGETVSVDIYVDVKGAVGVITNIATVTATTSDPDLANNTVRKDVNIQGGPGPR
jgi:uncharacterized repeat protein (TIGR01451 family)